MKRFIIICLFMQGAYAQKEPWTWHYHKMLDADEQHVHKKQDELIVSQVGIPAFTQLLFSWNAFRPKNDHYSFFIQVRDAQTQQWGTWHKMVDWGQDVQKSFATRSDGMSRYVHVRLETESYKMADAFRVKIYAPDADFSGMRSVTVSAANLHKFEPEQTMYISLPSVLISEVPQQSQLVLPHEKCRMMCSPTSCSMLLGYLTKKKVNPLQFAQHSFDHGLNVYGSWPFNTAHAFELSEGTMQFYTARLHSFQQLHKKLMKGIPIVVSVRGEIIGAPKSYNSGHLLLVVGFDAQKRVVICHDPAEIADHVTVKEYPLTSFIRAWERSRRLSYVAAPAQLA